MWHAWRRISVLLADKLWVRPAIASLFAAVLALAAVWADVESPSKLPVDISKDTLVNLLSMFATSMLTVATFSVATIVAAITAIAQSTTPRVTRLMLADRTVQNVLAAFISAFIFSVVAILALEALSYGPAGRLVLFAGLAAMMVWVLVSFLRWVDHVTHLGRVGTAMHKITEAALASMRPETVGTFGAKPLPPLTSPRGKAVLAQAVGFVVAVDVRELQALAEDRGISIDVLVRPGELVDRTAVLARILPEPAGDARPGDDRETMEGIRDAIDVSDERTIDDDPRFGLVVLAETAAKALSPAVNDPGTAIDILVAQLAVLSRWVDLCACEETREVCYPSIRVPPLLPSELVDDAFTSITRDGAGSLEVGVKLQKTLQAIARMGHRELADEACRISALAMELSATQPLADSQRARLAREARRVVAAAAAIDGVPPRSSEPAPDSPGGELAAVVKGPER